MKLSSIICLVFLTGTTLAGIPIRYRRGLPGVNLKDPNPSGFSGFNRQYYYQRPTWGGYGGYHGGGYGGGNHLSYGANNYATSSYGANNYGAIYGAGTYGGSYGGGSHIGGYSSGYGGSAYG